MTCCALQAGHAVASGMTAGRFPGNRHTEIILAEGKTHDPVTSNAALEQLRAKIWTRGAPKTAFDIVSLCQ